MSPRVAPRRSSPNSNCTLRGAHAIANHRPSEPSGSGFAATGGTLVATAVGVDDGGGAASFTYRDSEWALRGSVGFTIDALTLEVW